MLCPFCLEDTMNAKEREIRNKEIVKMRLDGFSMNQIAEHYGLNATTVWHVCKDNGVDGVMSDRKAVVNNPRNQYTNGVFDREANAICYINERTPNFEYAGNFTGVDGFVDLKCKTCGSVITRSFVSVKHGTAACDICKRREREWAEAERKRILELQKEERERQTRIKKPTKQLELSECKVCGNLFISKSSHMKYCSESCAHQNKWHMKDGYRKLFPLEEVYERDKGICYLCGKECDWNDYEVRDGVVIYGNNYPSRDHVIPKSRGGANSWDNIRLAHRLCNSLKWDSPSVEKIG